MRSEEVVLFKKWEQERDMPKCPCGCGRNISEAEWSAKFGSGSVGDILSGGLFMGHTVVQKSADEIILEQRLVGKGVEIDGLRESIEQFFQQSEGLRDDVKRLKKKNKKLKKINGKLQEDVVCALEEVDQVKEEHGMIADELGQKVQEVVAASPKLDFLEQLMQSISCVNLDGEHADLQKDMQDLVQLVAGFQVVDSSDDSDAPTFRIADEEGDSDSKKS